MSGKQIYLSLIAVVLLTTSTVGLPVVEQFPENPFDTGPIGNCLVPTAEQLPTCSKYINYPVPEALLSETIASIREKAVSGARESAESRELIAGDANMVAGCGSAVEKLECYKKFPSCLNDDTSVEFINENCESQLESSCTEHDSLIVYSCSNTNQQGLDLSTCTKATSTPYDYKYCSSLQGWSDVYLTEWMNVSLINSEREIEDFTMFGTSEECTVLYTELKCGEVGRCWHQGTRMEINSTKELCESVLNCVSSSLRNKLKQQLSCSSYPSMTEKLSTPATEITQPTVETEPDTPSPTQPEPTTEGLNDNNNDSTSKPPSVNFPADHTGSSATSHNNLLLLTILSSIIILSLLL